MIQKRREGSVQKERLEVLLRRLPAGGEAEEAEKEYQSVCAGEAGEARFGEFMEKSDLPFPNMVLHDLRMWTGEWIQVDSLLITPWCLYLFEVKNIAGRLRFMSQPSQLIRTTAGGVVDGMPNPVDQLQRMEFRLSNWLSERGYFLPIRPVLVLSHAKQVVEKAPEEVETLFSHQLPGFFRKLQAESAKISSRQMQEIAAGLLREHKPFQAKPICEDARYPLWKMKWGVWCSECSRLGMKRTFGKWTCPSCKAESRDAHIRTLQDWELLTGKPLTNKICRHILGVDDMYLVNRLLKGMDLVKTGSFRDAAYRFKEKGE